MRSLTVTVRIDIEAIVSCADLLSKHGLPTEGQPVSTVVRTALESITQLLRETRQLPSYQSDQEVEDRYALIFNDEDASVSGGLSMDGLSNILKGKAADDDPIARIAAQVDSALSSGHTPDVIRSTEPSETKDVTFQRADIRGLFHLPFESLQKQAPKDKYIEVCSLPDADPIFTKAVCIAYSGLDTTEWGGPTADRLITELLKMHKAGA